MPGSLLSSQDVHSDQSDVSFKSADSRTSGKKVSFNKAVRVKQYPWHPEESHDVQGSPLLSGRRFWFKVYKNNSNPPSQQNAWKSNDRPAWTEVNADDLHDSLTPIAEDEDGSDENDQHHAFNSYARNRMPQTFDENGNCFTGHPSDPPIDYIDEEPLFSRIKRQSLRKTEQIRPEIERNKQEQGRNRFKFIDNKIPGSDLRKNKATNGFSPPVRNSDFRRPTISSTAKSSVDKPAKQPLLNIRLPRAVAKEPTTDKRKESTSFSQRLRERRSRSNDENLNIDRLYDKANRLDKAVSTEDLSTELRAFEDNGKRNGFWGSQQKNKDKATQCTGTLTNYAKSNFNLIPNASKSARPTFLSTFTQSDIGSPSALRRDVDKNGHTFNGTDPKQLSLHGKNCISGVRRNEVDKMSDMKSVRMESKARYGGSNDSKLNGDRFEYDYVFDTSSAVDSKKTDLRQQQRANFQSFINRDEIDSKCKQSSWRAMVGNGFSASSVISNENETVGSGQRFSRADNLRASSVIGHVCGKPIPLSPNQQHMPSPTLRKMKIANGNETRKSISNNENGHRMFEAFSTERNSAPSKGRMFGVDDIESPIDWSMSGFRLSARSDNNLSSSSDSECIVHRRAPLLMYIPGVSHHHKPAIEDDRLSALSGMSRSEVEDDLSPFPFGGRNEFQRRYSMPRNGKLNFLKWKSSKKLMK